MMDIKNLYEKWKRYVHSNWDELKNISGSDSEKHYFVSIDFSKEEQSILDIEDELSVTFPESFVEFYRQVGFGFLCVNDKKKKGQYRIFSPEELLDLYFEPEDNNNEDIFITFRMSAWEKFEENNLLAFCSFGDEDSLIYIGVTDGAIYNLSPTRKIAESLYDFLSLMDEEVDYFIK